MSESPSNRNRPRAQWQLPKGLTRGIWEYVHSDSIATDYDNYFAQNRLFELDQQFIARHLSAESASGQTVADLGCGTGRALVPLVRRGFVGLAVDLSRKMLEIVQEKSDYESLNIHCLQANLVELDCLVDQSVDHAICMFSTLGMIKGRENRQRMLKHVARLLVPGGKFVLHVHNFWFNLYDPGGVGWVTGSLIRGWLGSDGEAGDKYFNYRGVHSMFLHVFRRRELLRDLRRAGFKIREVVQLDARRTRPLRCGWFCGSLRANGWLVACET